MDAVLQMWEGDRAVLLRREKKWRIEREVASLILTILMGLATLAMVVITFGGFILLHRPTGCRS
jgi:hypothetical protein